MPQPRKASRGAKVMLILDDAVQAEAIAAFLTEEGQSVDRSGSAEEALDAIQAGLQPQCIITTPELPGIDGWRLSRIVRTFPACRHIPILILTKEGGCADAVRVSSGLGPGVMLVDRSALARMGELVRRVLDGDVTGELVPVLMIAARGRVTSTLRRVFKQHGFSIRITTTPAGARRLLQDKPPAVVVYDVDATAISDGALSDHLGHLAAGAPLIVLSGSSSYKAEYLRKGAWMVVVQPVDPQRLVALCVQALSEQAMLLAEQGLIPREQRLVESEARYRALFENAIEGIFRSSLDGRLLLANPALAHMFGYASPQAAVESITDIGAQIYADPEDRARVIRRLLMEDEITAYEVNFKRTDGTLVWVVLNFYLQRDASGHPLYIEGTCVDITQRKQAEEELRCSRETFMKAFQSSPDPMSITALADGRFLELNDRFLRTFGYAREEAIGKTSVELGIIDDEQRARMRDVFLEGKGLREHAIQARTRQGERREGYMSGELIELQGQPHVLLVFHDITARKQAEENLRESEERQRAMANASFEAIVFSENGICFDVNEIATQMFGYSREELIGMPTMDFAAPESRDEVRRHVLLKSEEPYAAIGLRKDGSRFQTELRGRMFTYQGREVRATAVRDVSARVRAEQALRESEEKYRTLVENARVVVLQWDPSGKVTFMNEFGLALFGYAQEELVGRHVMGTIVPETESSGRDLAAMITEICRDPERFRDNENENVTKDGRRIWMHWSNKAMLDESGALVGILSIGSDITARKLAEDLLRRERDFTSNLIESSPAFIVTIDADGRTRMMNRAMLIALGFESGEVIGMDYAAAFVPESEHAGLAAVFERMRRTGEMTVNENPVRTRDGRELLIEWHGCPIGGAGGAFDAILGIGIDITARKQTEQELQAWIQRYELIVEASGQVAYDYIVPTGQITWGASLERVLGLTPEEMNGGFEQWQDLLHPDDRTEILQSLEVAEQDCAFWEARYRMRHMDGEYRWIRDRGFYLSGPDGKAYRMLGMMEDITAARKAEAELNYRATLLTTLQEASIEGILVVDANRRIVSFNRRFIDIWGIPKEVPDSGDDERTLQAAQCKVVDPEGLLAKVQFFYAHPTDSGRDEILFADGRTIDFYTAPVRGEGGVYYGRVWYVRDATEEKRAAEALRQSEEKYRSIFVNAMEGIYQSSPEGRYLSVNPAFARIFGYTSPEEMMAGITDIGQMLYAHPQERPHLLKILNEQDHIEGFETEVCRRDGTTRWISINARMVRDREGNLLYYEGSTFDITERKQAEEALRASEEKYRLVVDHAREGIFIAQDGMFKFANPFLPEILGYSLEELYPTPFVQFIHPDDRTMVADRHQRRLQGETVPEVYTFRVIDRAGSVRWVELNVVLIAWGGRPATLNFLADVTERRAAEEQLREANKRLEDIIEFLPDATFIMDRDKRIIAWNKAVEEMTGVPKAEMLGKDRSYGAVPFYGEPRLFLMDLVEKDDEEISALYMNVTRKGTMIQAEAFVPNLYQGRGAYVWVAASPLLDSEGRIVGAIESVRDITERKRAEEDLKQSEEKFAKAFNASPEAISIATRDDGIYMEVNEAFLQKTGYRREEVIGRTADDLGLWVTADDRQRYMEAFMTDGRVRNLEIPFRMRGGEVRYTLLSAELIYLRGKRCSINYGTDITERKRAEEALQLSEEKFAKAFNASPVVISISALDDGTYLDMNDAFVRMSGYAREEVIGRTTTDLDLWVDRQDRERFLAEIIKTGRVRDFEAQFRMRSGAIRDGILSAEIVVFQGRRCLLSYNIDITERKRANEALRASEELYRLLTENAYDMISRHAPDGTVLYVSPACRRMLGYDPEEMVGRAEEHIVHPDDLAEVRNSMRRRFQEGGETYTLQHRTIRKDGTWLWIETSGRFIRNADGSLKEIQCGVRDITERRRALEALRASEEKFRRVVESSPSGMHLYHLEDDGRLILIGANPAADHMLGVKHADLLGRTITEAFPHLVDTEIPDMYARVARNEIGPQSFETSYHDVRLEGVYAVSVFPTGKGSITVDFTDITERKRAEEALRTSESFLSNIIDQSPYPMWISDNKGTLIRLNQALLDLLRLSADEVIGKYNVFQDNIVEEQGFMPLVHRVYEEGEAVRFELIWDTTLLKSITVKESVFVILDVTIFPIRDAAGRIVNAVIQHQDITARRQAQAELEELDRELKRKNQELESIVYATSHDLRSPLLNIQGFGMRLEAACADLLEILRAPVVPDEVRTAAGEILDETIPKALKFIRSSVEKMDSLIKGLLQLSRLGRAELIMSPLDVKTMVEQVIAAMGFQIQQASATIELGDLPACRGDATQLGQVFSNLIDNALKYRSPVREALIRVYGRIAGDQCIYCVEDNGVGIPEAHREKIWELFHRLDPGGEVSGEGLGLTVVRRILDRHKGKVWLEETDTGTGSRFCFTLKQVGTHAG